MNAPIIINRPYNWWTSRDGQPIVAIIAHNTVGTDSRTYLSRGGERPDGSDRKVSIHVLIRKTGTIYRYVPDERGANHAGYGVMPLPWAHINPNRCTLGFELENASNGVGVVDPYPDAQLLAMGWQVAEWRKRYGHLPIFRHAEIDPSRRKDTAGGLLVADIERWIERASAAAPQIKRYTVKRAATAGATIRSAPRRSAAVLGRLRAGDAWEGEEEKGETVNLQGFGTTDVWINNAGRRVWSGLLQEVKK